MQLKLILVFCVRVLRVLPNQSARSNCILALLPYSRLLGFSLDESKIRSQDSVSIIDSVASNPAGRVIAWQFVQEHYSELYDR